MRQNDIARIKDSKRISSFKQPKAFIKSLGCISNLMDGTWYERLVTEAGFQLTSDISQADLILLNSCAFNKVKENETVENIRRIKARSKTSARIIICGCFPKINLTKLNEIHSGIYFAPKDFSTLQDILNLNRELYEDSGGPISYNQLSFLKRLIYHSKKVVNLIPFLQYLPIVNRTLEPFFIYDNRIYCIKVATGCIGRCSYCAIRYAKGRVVSKSMETIKSEFHRALALGYTRFVLTGDEISAYGFDLGKSASIIDVLKIFLDHNKVTKVYIESIEPSFMINNLTELLPIFESGKIPVFCTSVQSGSNRILKLMKRNYRADEFIDSMKVIKRQNPNLRTRTEIMVGFPGETESYFQSSIDLVKTLKFDFVRAFIYEERPNTPAEKMPNKISLDIKKRRRKQIIWRHCRNVLGI